MGRPARGGESPVCDIRSTPRCLCLSTTEHVEFRGKQGRPLSKAKYSWRPIVNKYREGKVKSTRMTGVKEYLKPYADKQSESGASWMMACLLENEPASYSVWPG